jgi:periplasmic divalent cation tolerance protein
MLIVYVPCGSDGEARGISEKLIKERLIACANIVKSKSLFEWKGSMKREDEWVIHAKTIEKNVEKIEKRVKELHSYELPCIISIPAKANPEYVEWLQKQTR